MYILLLNLIKKTTIITVIKTGNQCMAVLHQWNVKTNDKNGNGNLSNFIKSRKNQSTK